MRASVLRDGRMVYRDDVPDPVPGPGQVLVAVRACGICGSDLHFAAHGADVLSLSNQMSQRGARRHERRSQPRRLHGSRIQRRGTRGRARHRNPSGREPLVTSIPVLLSGKGVEPIVYSNTTLGGYAERMLLSAPLLLPIPNGLGPQARRADRAHGGRAARRQQVQHRSPARPHWCSVADRSASPSSLRCGRAASKPLWQPTFRRSGANWPPRWARTGRSIPAQGSPFDTVKAAVVFEAVGVPGIIDDVMRRARHGHPVGRRRRVHASPTPCIRSSRSPKRSTCSSFSPTTPNEFAESLRAIAEGDIDVAPMITGEVGLEASARRSTIWPTPNGIARYWSPRRSTSPPAGACGTIVGLKPYRHPALVYLDASWLTHHVEHDVEQPSAKAVHRPGVATTDAPRRHHANAGAEPATADAAAPPGERRPGRRRRLSTSCNAALASSC